MEKNNFDYLLVSSSSRKLYQENVFNGIALPNNYVIQYRYSLDYLDDEIKNGINHDGYICQYVLDDYFNNKKCILSYLHIVGETENASYSLHVFRSGLIKKAIFNSKINRLLLYIELQDYVSLQDNDFTLGYISKVIEKFQFDGSICVFDLTGNKEFENSVKKVEFHEVAEKFINLLPVELIFSVNLKRKVNNIATQEFSDTIIPKTDLSTNLTRYELNNRSNYYFEILTYEKTNIIEKEKDNKKIVNIELDPIYPSLYVQNNGSHNNNYIDLTIKDISAENVNTCKKEKNNSLIVDIQSDTIYLNQHVQNNGSNNINYIDLIIKPISAETVNTNVKFNEPNSKFITNILIDVKKSKLNSFLFSISSMLVLIAVPIANYFKDKLTSSEFSNLNIFLFICYIFATVTALRFLYRYFDKK